MMWLCSVLMFFHFGEGFSKRWEASEFDRIQIAGWSADLQIRANEDIKMARIRSRSGLNGEVVPLDFSVVNRSLVIRVRGTGKSQPVDLQIEVPSRLLEVSLRSGRVSLLGWKKPVVGSLINGQFSSKEGTGSQKVSVKQGKIEISGSEGPLELANYSGETFLTEIKSDIDLTQFAGAAQLSKVEGAVKLKGYSANLTLLESKGRVNFHLNGGRFRTRDMEGIVEGSSKEANLYLGVSPTANVRVKSETGKVIVSLPEEAATYLNFGSESGDIVVPDYFVVDRLINMKVARGRLRGTSGRGSVRVRTVSGLAIFRVDR